MAKYMQLKIINSKSKAVNGKKWKDPGAKLYDQCLNAFYSQGDVPCDSKQLNQAMKDGTYKQWPDFLKEVYLVAPVSNIKNSPHGVTPYSRSGCKYPHHIIRNGELVVSIPGLKHAWDQAFYQKSMTPEVKRHLNRHMKELGLTNQWHHGQLYWNEEAESWEEIENNFLFIEDYIEESIGIDLHFTTDDGTNKPKLRTESVILEEQGEFCSKIFEETGRTPEELCTWMQSNISYDKTISGWKLKSPEETFLEKKGNCHDQSLFSIFLLHSLGIITSQLFFIEFQENNPIGGNTHTLTWYKENKKIYWMESAWESQAGIHGPYDSMDDLEMDIRSIYLKDDDLNSNKYDGILFGKFSSYKVGYSLGDYVESWKIEDFPKTIENSINESSEWIERFVYNDRFRESVNPSELNNTHEAVEEVPPSISDEPKEESLPKKTDKAESSKNGIRRKNLYIEFIKWCKEYNPKNTFGSIFDKDAFNISYPFVPEDMRYFYRLSNPMLCVLAGDLTFFAVAELRKLNIKNSRIQELIIFAATPNDTRVFNIKDKKIYRGTEENGAVKLNEVLGDNFDAYIQKMINKGDILNAPITEKTEYVE